MESQGHYTETFSCLLVFHLSIDLINFAICLLLTYNYIFFILSNFDFYYNYFGLFYHCIFSQYRHIHLMQSNTSKMTLFFTKINGCNRTTKKEK